MVNFVAAVPYHFCLALPAAFTQPGAQQVVIVVSLTERGLSWATWIVRLSKLICGHLVIVVSFTEGGNSEGMRSSLLAKLLCEQVVVVVSLTERGCSEAE